MCESRFLQTKSLNAFQEDSELLYFSMAYVQSGMRNVIALNLDDQILNPTSMAFPLDSELVQPFSLFILKLRETGVLRKLKMKWKLARDVRLNEASGESSSGIVLGFENVSFPFAVLVAGILAAMFVSLMESISRVKDQ